GALRGVEACRPARALTSPRIGRSGHLRPPSAREVLTPGGADTRWRQPSGPLARPSCDDRKTARRTSLPRDAGAWQGARWTANDTDRPPGRPAENGGDPMKSVSTKGLHT